MFEAGSSIEPAASAPLPTSNHRLAQTYTTASVHGNHHAVSLLASKNLEERRCS